MIFFFPSVDFPRILSDDSVDVSSWLLIVVVVSSVSSGSDGVWVIRTHRGATRGALGRC